LNAPGSKYLKLEDEEKLSNFAFNFDTRRYSMGASVVAQRYLTKPFLIDGYKFDLRIYALVLCCDPLRIHVYNDGLARFCTELYEVGRCRFTVSNPALKASMAII
jgi:hypothetical protein